MVEISDIRRERLTEDDAREEVSDYAIFRFEKVDEGGYDTDGEEITPTWENVVRTAVYDISKTEAARQIRHLNQKGPNVGEKKRNLIPAQQRQLEKALEELMAMEHDPRFHFVLVQIDHQLQPLTKREAKRLRKYGYTKERRRSKSKDKVNKDYYRDRERERDRGRDRTRSRAGSKDGKKKRLWTRRSITAFYKRCPREGENPHFILQQRQMEAARRLMPPYNPNVFPQQGQFPQHPQAAGMQQRMPMARAQQVGAQGNKMPNGVQVVNQNGKKANEKVYEKKYHPQARSPRSSHSSVSYSSESTSDSEDDTVITPPSDSSDSRRSGHRGRRRNSRTRYIEGPGHYGLQPGGGRPRRHSRLDEHHILDDLPRVPLAPTSIPRIAPIASAEDIEVIKTNAYAAGRADERLQSRVLAVEEAVAAESAVARGYLPRTAPRPQVIQRRSSGVRIVRPVDVELDDDAVVDRMARLRLDEVERERERRLVDEELYLEELDRRDELRRRREIEALRLAEEDQLLAEEQEMERERERAARQYIRRRESSPGVGVHFVNPFVPRRRATITPRYNY